jgi:hypothetical protein
LVAESYERFFKWVQLILEVREKPFRQLIETKMESSLIEAIGHLRFVIGDEIARFLNSYETKPNYLSRLDDFLPSQGRLKEASGPNFWRRVFCGRKRRSSETAVEFTVIGPGWNAYCAGRTGCWQMPCDEG